MNDALETVTARVAYALIDSEDAVLVDVRDASAYDEAHPAPARSIPIGELADRLDELPADVIVITSCGGGTRGPKAATLLRELGINARSMQGGLKAWRAAELPVDGA